MNPVLEAEKLASATLTIAEYDGESITDIRNDSEFVTVCTKYGCNLCVREEMSYRIIETCDTKKDAKVLKGTILKGLAFGATYFRLDGGGV